ncbi:MAG TPA: hypothetical protein VFP37_09850, partial [Steroidobacteraceae bacterium]|nr:hypothetical protein [Steroidobacteraceae bacterium]
KARVWNERRTLKDLDQSLREAQNRWVRVQKARSSMPNNTGEFAARVEALRARLDAAQVRLAAVARQQNGLLESLARDELEQQKERIGTYQIQARFALAAIYDRAAAPAGAAPAAAPQESQGELQDVPAEESAPLDGAAPAPPVEPAQPDSGATTSAPADSAPGPQPTDSVEPAVDTSGTPPEAPK